MQDDDQKRTSLVILPRPLLECCRGVGMFLGLELVKDREKRTPATIEAQIVINR